MIVFFARIARSSGLSIKNCSNTRQWYSSGHRVSSVVDNVPLFAAYLMQTFGLTESYAIKASKNITSLDHPNSVIAFFKEQGFSDHQISKVIKARPNLLSYKLENMKPTFDFLKSIITDPSEVNRILSTYSVLLKFSVERRLIPSFNMLSKLFGSERDAGIAVRRAGDILLIDPCSPAAEKVMILIKYGVPASKLLILLRQRCCALRTKPALLEETMEDVRKMGFNPKTSKFVIALMMCMTMGKQSWERKVKVYKDCGWTEEEFVKAFRRNPYIVGCSDDKLTSIMNHLREVGIESCRVAMYPLVLGMSFKKRIVPRASVFKVLNSKGKLNRLINLHSVFCDSETKFVERYIVRYGDVHGLEELYRKAKSS